MDVIKNWLDYLVLNEGILCVDECFGVILSCIWDKLWFVNIIFFCFEFV